MKKEEVINEIIQTRKSVYPIQYIDEEISNEIIHQILENADRAPTHKLTEPWRFKVVSNEKKDELAKFMANKCKPIIFFQRDQKNHLPEWEEIASTAMAVQNMYLTCTAYNIGCYWSSPNLIDYIGEFIHLKEGERCIGLFYMGYYQADLPVSKRSPLEEKFEWLL